MKQTEIESHYESLLSEYLENFEQLAMENDDGKMRTSLTKTQLKNEIESLINELSGLLKEIKGNKKRTGKQVMSDRMSNLITALQNTPDIGVIQAGSEYRIINRSTGEVLEICHTEEYAKKVLEKYK